MAKRLQAMGQVRYRHGFRVTLQPDIVELPLRWKQPRMIFVNSMSDLFHKQVPAEFIAQCFEVMAKASWHTFQVLTKRPERAVELAPRLPWPDNVWMGASVESAEFTRRFSVLCEIPATVRFASLEPLLGPVGDLPLAGIHWVIVGGESGPGARPISPAWVCSVRDFCVSRKVPFFFKQWGGIFKTKRGRHLDGRTWDEVPGTSRRLRGRCSSVSG
jgi:protein gp37